MGIRWELNPNLLLHRQMCLPHTPRTPSSSQRKERDLNPQGTLKMLNRLPTGPHRLWGWSFRFSVSNISRFIQQPDQDLNLERRVRSPV